MKAVSVVEVDAMTRIEMSGVALGNGWLGDRIWVRLATANADGSPRLELGVVKSGALLEVEP